MSPFFFFNDTATTEIYTLSLHDALPISSRSALPPGLSLCITRFSEVIAHRSEEHTSELQSHSDLVCRLLLEKKKNRTARWHAPFLPLPASVSPSATPPGRARLQGRGSRV